MTTKLPELTAMEKRAYVAALNGSCMDETFLSQFEGTPLYPQAIALAEQELAVEQRQLQARMQRSAQQSSMNYDQEYMEREGIELQKKQLLIQMHKMKVMGQGAPTPPGQAVIGTPDPAQQMMAAAPAPARDPAAGGAPPMGAEKVAALRKFAQKLRIKQAAGAFDSHKNKDLLSSLEAGMTTQDPSAVPLGAALPFGSLYTGYQRGAAAGDPVEGMARGFGGGTLGALVGTLGGPLAPVTVPVGKAVGTHLATRGMLQHPTALHYADAATKQANVTDDKPSYMAAALPFGDTYLGYQRGKMTGRGGEGALRGIVGGTLGGGVGATLGRLPGQMVLAYGSDSKVGLPLLIGGQLLGQLVGDAQGAHLATRGMLPQGE